MTRMPVGEIYFMSSPNLVALGRIQPAIQCVPEESDVCVWGKAVGALSCPLPFSAGVKNAWKYTSSPSMPLLLVQGQRYLFYVLLKKYGRKCTFLLSVAISFFFS